MNRYKIRKSLEEKIDLIVVIIGTFKWYDKNYRNEPMFEKIEYLKENEFKDIHIKRKNIINPKILKPNKKYIIIGKVYKYYNETKNVNNYSLKDVCLIPIDE